MMANRLGVWGALGGLLVTYVLAGKLGLQFAFVHASATPLWPPTGIALAMLILGGYRLWPIVFLGALLVNVTTAGSVATSLGIAGGNALEAVLGAYLVHRFANGREAFKRPMTIFVFAAVAGFVATAVSASIGVTSLALGGYASWPAWAEIWLTWWLGDAAGALVIAPFLIVWAVEPGMAEFRRRRLEVIGLGVVTAAVAAIVFGGALHAGTRNAPTAFLCLPPLVWAAYRFGPRGATTGLVVLSAIATAATLSGSGPFAVGTPNGSLLLLQAFLLTMSVTILSLAALADELARRAASSAENARLYRWSEGQRRTADAFLETSRALTLSLDLRDVAGRIVGAVRELLGGTVAIVFRIDEATGAYEALAVAGDAGAEFGGAFTIPAGVGTIGLAVREQRAVMTPDVTTDPRITLTPEIRARLARAAHRSVLAVPLVADGQTIGAFLVGDQAGRTYTEDQKVVAEAFGHHAALAIANAQRFEQSQREQQELSDFFENATVPLHWVGADGTILRANRAELELLGYASEEYVGRHIADFHADAGTIDEILRRLKAGETIRDCPARLRARDGSIRDVIIDSNVQWADGHFVHTRSFTRDVTSLRRAEEAMGRLLAAERGAREEAEAARVRAEDAERQMATLSDIAHSITSSLDLDTVLQRIAEGAQELCRSDTAAMFVRDGESEAMVPRYRVGPAVQAYDGLRIEPGRGIGGHVLSTGQPLRTAHYLADPRVPDTFHAIARETGTVTLMVVPITIRGRVEGLLYISNRTPRAFTKHDEAVCMRLAEQAAAALSNARLFADAESARAQAEAASHAKDEFLAVLSHELRTPLNAIVGWARMLQTGTVAPSAVANAIEIIDRNAAAQVRLVEDLLDVSRIVSGTLSVDLAPVRLATVLAAAIDAVRPAAERKGVRLVSDVAPTVDSVMADAGRLQQAVWNLVVNAVKFTPASGTVTVSAATDADTVWIRVGDTGCGIDTALLPHIFDRFRQGDSSTTRKHGGLGLGLTLVKHIVELHGGTVTAESGGPGTGAAFTLTLQHSAEPERALRPRPAGRALTRVELSGVTVLVVDDEPDARELCAQALARHGAVVATADSATEALERLRADTPDVVIADIGMPGVDGFAFIQRLRAQDAERGRRTLAMALTAYASAEDRLRALEAGFDDHIAKPFDPVELARTIHRCVRSQ
jgi:PAS domain S-box-containing protein